MNIHVKLPVLHGRFEPLEGIWLKAMMANISNIILSAAFSLTINL